MRLVIISLNWKKFIYFFEFNLSLFDRLKEGKEEKKTVGSCGLARRFAAV